MNRRAFISKTALAAIAAPFLPTALATPPKPKANKWDCIALCRRDEGHVTLHTDDVDNVIGFLDQCMDDRAFYRIEIYANGRLFMVHKRTRNRSYYNEWIPIIVYRSPIT